MITGGDGHFRLEGRVDMSNADAILKEGAHQLFNGHPATVDLGGVTAVDSAAISLLLEWQRTAAAARQNIHFVNLPAALRSLAELYGVSELIESGGASKD
ncbi:MAG: STAS domain-containing protein [Burkholderiales bacterium]